MSISPTKFIDAPDRVFAGLAGHFTFESMAEIPALWGRFGPHIGSLPYQVGRVAYGICRDMNDQGFDYTACVEVSGADGLPGELSASSLPACHYAVFTHIGHVSTLCNTIDAIWHQWLPESGRQLIDSPHMIEAYDERFDPATASGVTEVWIPLKP